MHRLSSTSQSSMWSSVFSLVFRGIYDQAHRIFAKVARSEASYPYRKPATQSIDTQAYFSVPQKPHLPSVSDPEFKPQISWSP